MRTFRSERDDAPSPTPPAPNPPIAPEQPPVPDHRPIEIDPPQPGKSVVVRIEETTETRKVIKLVIMTGGAGGVYRSERVTHAKSEAAVYVSQMDYAEGEDVKVYARYDDDAVRIFDAPSASALDEN